jgi:hypothetical protein
MDILGIVGFAFAATAAAVLVYEHQTDVLRGRTIEGRARPRYFAAAFASVEKAILDPARALACAVVARLNWNTVGYLASLA